MFYQKQKLCVLCHSVLSPLPLHKRKPRFVGGALNIKLRYVWLVWYSVLFFLLQGTLPFNRYGNCNRHCCYGELGITQKKRSTVFLRGQKVGKPLVIYAPIGLLARS